jgi:Protein of unknown function (DUF1254)
MPESSNWSQVCEAIAFANDKVTKDSDPLNEREVADGQQYVARMLTAVSDAALLTIDPFRPQFLPMLESVRYVGAAGPDIDYDVAIVLPGATYCIEGNRGTATFVGIAVYTHDGDKGATAIVDHVDVDTLVQADGTFRYEFSHPHAARVIVRQYFHDRTSQHRGDWSISFVGDAPEGGANGPQLLPTVEGMEARVLNLAQSLRWNAQLNDLWMPGSRNTPNEFMRLTPEDIVAAITNPDVMYSFTWWRLAEGEALLIEFTPPETRYWGLQLCDRWFQCFPNRRTSLNDQHIEFEADGSVRIAISERDPGIPNWLETSGHRIGTLFFRWLNADPIVQPTCRVVPLAELSN